MTEGTLEEVAAICALKYSYFRCLDTKRFDELGDLLTEDATSAYKSGELSQQGRDGIVAFLKESLSDPGMITMHTGHHPEIQLTADGEATGTWYLEDRVIMLAADLEIQGTALY
ncbi:MAG: nuclear transport factor 2 family protein, partial [Acidimicrobiales bacterium]